MLEAPAKILLSRYFMQIIWFFYCKFAVLTANSAPTPVLTQQNHLTLVYNQFPAPLSVFYDVYVRI